MYTITQKQIMGYYKESIRGNASYGMSWDENNLNKQIAIMMAGNQLDLVGS